MLDERQLDSLRGGTTALTQRR